MSGIRFVDDCFTQYIYLRHSTADLARARALAEHFRIHAFPPACVLEVEPAAPAHIVCMRMQIHPGSARPRTYLPLAE